MKYIVWITIGFAVLANVAESQVVFGKYAGEFLALGVGGRSLAMGSAAVATTGDVTAGYWNPAGLAQIQYPQGILMHAEQFGSLENHDYVAIAIPYGPNTSLGLSVIRLGVDDIPNTAGAGLDANGNITYDPAQFTRLDYSKITSFNAADWAFLFTYARAASDDFSYGVNLKIIRRDIDTYGATGIGFDVGVLYKIHPQISVGANIQDITTTMVAWNTGRKELIAPTVKIGASGYVDALAGRFTPAVDFDVRFENRQTASMFHVGAVSVDVHSGIEYTFKNVVSLRAGYTDIKAPAFGAGIHLPKLNIDYSFLKFDKTDQLGDTHRISLMFTLESDRFKRPSD